MSEVKRFKPVINNKPYRPYAYCEENSEGIYVRIDDYEAIKAERDALAAESQVLDSAIGAIADAYETGLKDLLANEIDTAINTSTPATEAYLNSVRADTLIRIINTGQFSNWVNQGLQEWVNRFIANSDAQLRNGKDGE